VWLGFVNPAFASPATAADVEDAVGEMEALYDAAGLLRSVRDTTAPGEVAVRIRSLLASGRYRLVTPPE
jgi:hypothetical protein